MTTTVEQLLAALESINTMACYACEEDVNSRYEILLKIGETARAAIEAEKRVPFYGVRVNPIAD